MLRTVYVYLIFIETFQCFNRKKRVVKIINERLITLLFLFLEMIKLMNTTLLHFQPFT